MYIEFKDTGITYGKRRSIMRFAPEVEGDAYKFFKLMYLYRDCIRDIEIGEFLGIERTFSVLFEFPLEILEKKAASLSMRYIVSSKTGIVGDIIYSKKGSWPGDNAIMRARDKYQISVEQGASGLIPFEYE